MLAATTAVQACCPASCGQAWNPVLLAGLAVAGSLSLSRCNRDRARDLPRMHRDLSLWQSSRRSAHREREKRELNAMRTLTVRDLLE